MNSLHGCFSIIGRARARAALSKSTPVLQSHPLRNSAATPKSMLTLRNGGPLVQQTSASLFVLLSSLLITLLL